MELNQMLSTMKKKEKEHLKHKKKRLTFLDEVAAVKTEEKPRIVKAKTTTFLTFGLCLIKSFSQQGLDIVGAKRELCFQKYQFSMVRIISYCEKFNVYFVLQKDFAIKVYNKNYLEVCSIENPGSGWLTFISFNPLRDEVICGGVKGVKIWKFKEKEVPDYSNPDTLFNYSLVLSTEYTHMAKKWCTNMDFDVGLQRFYCFSDSHFFCYDRNGKLLLEIPNAHQGAILSCAYSTDASILLTSSKGTENGYIKLWSFATMELFYSFSPFQDGILWMSTIENKMLYCSTVRDLHIYDLNSFTSFWAHVRSPVHHLSLSGADGKSSRVVVLSIDNSLRIFSLQDAMKLCTVLPPPAPPLLKPVLSFTYNRASGTVYLLLTPWDIWVYTASLSSPLCYLIDEGVVYADSQEFLVLGMQVIQLRHDVAQKQLIIMCQGSKSKLIHFRSLPALELVYSVDAANDTNVFTRLKKALFVGMESGAVDIFTILSREDQTSKEDVNTAMLRALSDTKEENEDTDDSDGSDNYHRGAVVAVDSCKHLSIFLSCGLDFIVKLWDLQKKLIAEITLDNTLNTACFLNSSGDILLAFKNDLYLLSHKKILDLPKSRTVTSQVQKSESFILESQTSDEQEKDKAGVSKASEMESYLEGLPMAPSKIYCSPCTSEDSLRMYDFLLQPSTPTLEEQDKAEMSRRMIVTKDMKYVPGPKVPPDCEIPFFGVSPCASLIFEQFKTETKPEDQVADTESEVASAEFIQEEATIKEQQEIGEETAPELTAPELMAPELAAPELTAPELTAPELTSPEALKIMPERICCSEEKQILQSVLDLGIPKMSISTVYFHSVSKYYSEL
ncbi:hypothetical protein lerEdw1_015687 [Lerista edwardsae]|nr:hypothetical protein lerEdw1_015687 [Lerista edwardsae]